MEENSVGIQQVRAAFPDQSDKPTASAVIADKINEAVMQYGLRGQAASEAVTACINRSADLLAHLATGGSVKAFVTALCDASPMLRANGNRVFISAETRMSGRYTPEEIKALQDKNSNVVFER